MDNILNAELMDNQQPRSSNRYGYIYLTTNKINNKKYIGQKKSSAFNPQYLGSGKLLKRAIEKYGRDSFSVVLLEWASDKAMLDSLEIKYIKDYGAVSSDDYYNLAKGGQHAGSDIYPSGVPPMYGKHHSEESKVKMSESNKGQKRSEIAKQHMKENHADFSGSKNPMYGVHLALSDERKAHLSQVMTGKMAGDAHPMYGKHHSETSKMQMSNSHKGKIWITNKVDTEILINSDDIDKYPEFIRGRLRKNRG